MRRPVLTLWAAVVAERLGFDWDLHKSKAPAGYGAGHLVGRDSLQKAMEQRGIAVARE